MGEVELSSVAALISAGEVRPTVTMSETALRSARRRPWLRRERRSRGGREGRSGRARQCFAKVFGK